MRKLRNVLLILIVIVLTAACAGCDYISYKDYYTIENYAEIWDLSGLAFQRVDSHFLFPQKIEDYDVANFLCRYDQQLPLGEGVQILLEVQFEDEEALTAEQNRIAAIATVCTEHFQASLLEAYAISLGENLFYEYALVDKDQNKIYFIYLQDIPKKEIEFPHSLLPDSYSRYLEIPLSL